MTAILLLILVICHFAKAHWVGEISSQNTYANIVDETKSTNITITFSEKRILGKEGWVTVTIDGVLRPDINNDWIAVYTSDSDVKERAPIKTKYLNNDLVYEKTGRIQTSLHLINMMEDYVVRFYRFSSYSLHLLAVSEVVVFVDKSMPLQGHLALTSNPTEMSISWSSREKDVQMVQWGFTTNSYTFEAFATPKTYSPSDLCSSPANSFGYKNPGWVYYGVMSGLAPGKLYHYRYGSEDNGWSQDYTFIAPSKRHVSMIAFADMGKWDTDGSGGRRDDKGSVNVTRHLRSVADQSDLMLLFGDLSYSVGYLSQWDEYMHSIEFIATKIPVMGSIGNHELDGGECGVPYRVRFNMPTPSEKADYYSFNYGNVHIIMMDTESKFTEDSAQYQFILEDLQHLNRNEYPWVIVTSHSPFYIDTKDSPYPMQERAKILRDTYEDIFIEYNVNLVLTGHHHTYQRTCPVYKEKCEQTGYPIYLVIGTAGSNLFHTFQDPTPKWIAYESDKAYGYSIITTEAHT